jgi:chemotaxis protein MotB
MNKDREVPVRIIIKKKRHSHGHHGGAWKVAFADFMTAMFALFLVLWLINQSSDVKSAIAGYFQDPLGRANEFGSSILPGEGAQASTPRVMNLREVLDLRRDRLQKLADQIEQKMSETPDLAAVQDFVDMRLTDEGLEIELTEDPKGVFFETGRPTPSRRGQEILALLGVELGALGNEVRIEGYTDARPYSQSRRYSNWELSADRANAARHILTDNGLAQNRVREIRGHADRNLRDPSQPYSASNRRITITVLLQRMDAGPQADAAPAPPRPDIDSSKVAATPDTAHAPADGAEATTAVEDPR